MSFERILQELEKAASERARTNFVAYFSSIKSEPARSFFPSGVITEQHPPATEWVLIPKYTINRYAKFWLVKWPVRVSFLVSKIKKIVNEVNEMKNGIESIISLTGNTTIKSLVEKLANNISEANIEQFSSAVDYFEKVRDILTGVLTTLERRKEVNIKDLDYLREFVKEYIMGPFDKFFIETIQWGTFERNETTFAIGDVIPYLQFSGAGVIQGTIYAVAPNTINFDGKSASIFQWFNYVRGTQLARRYQTLVLDYEDFQLYIYPTNFSILESANKAVVSFSMDFIATRMVRVNLSGSLEAPQDLPDIQKGDYDKWLSRNYKEENIRKAFRKS